MKFLDLLIHLIGKTCFYMIQINNITRKIDNRVDLLDFCEVDLSNLYMYERQSNFPIIFHSVLKTLSVESMEY